jgi:hypothetical protein
VLPQQSGDWYLFEIEEPLTDVSCHDGPFIATWYLLVGFAWSQEDKTAIEALQVEDLEERRPDSPEL